MSIPDILGKAMRRVQWPKRNLASCRPRHWGELERIARAAVVNLSRRMHLHPSGASPCLATPTLCRSGRKSAVHFAARCLHCDGRTTGLRVRRCGLDPVPFVRRWSAAEIIGASGSTAMPFDESRTLASPTGAALHLLVRRTDAPARGVVHVCHGLAEHAGRYARFADALAARRLSHLRARPSRPWPHDSAGCAARPVCGKRRRGEGARRHRRRARPYRQRSIPACRSSYSAIPWAASLR